MVRKLYLVFEILKKRCICESKANFKSVIRKFVKFQCFFLFLYDYWQEHIMHQIFISIDNSLR